MTYRQVVVHPIKRFRLIDPKASLPTLSPPLNQIISFAEISSVQEPQDCVRLLVS